MIRVVQQVSFKLIEKLGTKKRQLTGFRLLRGQGSSTQELVMDLLVHRGSHLSKVQKPQDIH